MDNIRKHIASLFNLSEEQASIFLSGFTRKELKKNDVFLEEGENCNKIGLIEKGLMKCVFNKDGSEIIFEFGFENSFISDYYSFVTNMPSAKEIRCIEDTTIHILTRESLKELGKNHLFMERMSMQMNEKLFLRMHNRLKSFLLETAFERYKNLISEKPDLARRIPQYRIASYLNVKPETISRIRKKYTI